MFNAENNLRWLEESSHESNDAIDSAQDLQIEITALNPDNRREVEQLIALFKEHYGNNHPVDGVYNYDYWFRLTDDVEGEQPQLVSLLVRWNSELVAHLGCRLNAEHSQAELVLPAIRPSSRKYLFGICRLLWQAVEQLATRQSWNSVYHYNLTSQPIWQVLAKKCFHATECALIPPCESFSFPDLQFRDPSHRGGLLIMLNRFMPLKSLPRFVPPEHREITQFLYRQFEIIPRENSHSDIHLVSDANPPIKNNSQNNLEEPPLRISHRKSLGLTEFIIHPSKMTKAGLDNCLREINSHAQKTEREQNRLALLVNLNDPACPELSHRVLDLGFRFSGVLMQSEEHDYLVLCRYNAEQLSKLTVYSPVAKQLKSYMRDQLDS